MTISFAVETLNSFSIKAQHVVREFGYIKLFITIRTTSGLWATYGRGDIFHKNRLSGLMMGVYAPI